MFRALVTGTAQALMHRKGAEGYLVFGGGQSEPYSWTCIPKKHTSTPSISSKANSALVRYGKDSDISPESTNLEQRAFCFDPCGTGELQVGSALWTTGPGSSELQPHSL